MKKLVERIKKFCINSHRTETLKRYVKLLNQEGYIKYKGHSWEVIR